MFVENRSQTQLCYHSTPEPFFWAKPLTHDLTADLDTNATVRACAQFPPESQIPHAALRNKMDTSKYQTDPESLCPRHSRLAQLYRKQTRLIAGNFLLPTIEKKIPDLDHRALCQSSRQQNQQQKQLMSRQKDSCI